MQPYKTNVWQVQAMRACWAARKLCLPCLQPVAFGTLSGFHCKDSGMGLELEPAPWLRVSQQSLGADWMGHEVPPQHRATLQDLLSTPGSPHSARSIPIAPLVYPRHVSCSWPGTNQHQQQDPKHLLDGCTAGTSDFGNGQIHASPPCWLQAPGCDAGDEPISKGRSLGAIYLAKPSGCPQKGSLPATGTCPAGERRWGVGPPFRRYYTCTHTKTILFYTQASPSSHTGLTHSPPRRTR